MKKTTQRLVSRILLLATLIGIVSIPFFSLLAEDNSPVKDVVFTASTTVPTETVVPVTTEAVTEPIIETTEIVTETTVETVPDTTPEPTRQESFYTYTEKELDLLARLVQAEGGGESYETKLKIASVVMNRVSDPKKFPDTIKGVIYAKNQFSVTRKKKSTGKAAIDYPASKESRKAAKEVLDNGSVLPPKVQVFYAKGCKGSWVTSREIYGTFDKTVFAYIYKKKG